jgi:hypothetical protein
MIQTNNALGIPFRFTSIANRFKPIILNHFTKPYAALNFGALGVSSDGHIKGTGGRPPSIKKTQHRCGAWEE